ncbi:TPA: hypothetical protein G8R27_003398 [Salmonella enterica]|nr:hypothetical protein [Salmonella enterica]HEM6828723.1 hypothetical protein [Citrobacter koseri]HEM6879339.1 hypothetical protein [Citrobacter koseri]HEM8004874.1 hypothetical protein [Citrobacter koseri]
MLIALEIALIILCSRAVALGIGKAKGTGNTIVDSILVAAFFVGIYLFLKSVHMVAAHIFTVFVLFGALGIILEKKKKPEAAPSSTPTSDHSSLSSCSPVPSNYQLVSFSYISASNEETFREVDVKEVDEVHITGYCHLRKQLRTFRIDRVKDQEIVIRDSGEVINVYDWITLLYPLPEV